MLTEFMNGIKLLTLLPSPSRDLGTALWSNAMCLVFLPTACRSLELNLVS